jgi:hypothetical protein
MTMHEIIDVAGAGAMLALVIRWALNLSVEWHWTACIGAASLLLQQWLGPRLGLTTPAHGVAEVLAGAILSYAALAAAEVIRAR